MQSPSLRSLSESEPVRTRNSGQSDRQVDRVRPKCSLIWRQSGNFPEAGRTGREFSKKRQAQQGDPGGESDDVGQSDQVTSTAESSRDTLTK